MGVGGAGWEARCVSMGNVTARRVLHTPHSHPKSFSLQAPLTTTLGTTPEGSAYPARSLA